MHADFLWSFIKTHISSTQKWIELVFSLILVNDLKVLRSTNTTPHGDLVVMASYVEIFTLEFRMFLFKISKAFVRKWFEVLQTSLMTY